MNACCMTDYEIISFLSKYGRVLSRGGVLDSFRTLTGKLQLERAVHITVMKSGKQENHDIYFREKNPKMKQMQYFIKRCSIFPEAK